MLEALSIAVFFIMLIALPAMLIALPFVAVLAVITIVYTAYWHVRRRRNSSEWNLAGRNIRAGIIVSLILIIYLGAVSSLLLLRP